MCTPAQISLIWLSFALNVENCSQKNLSSWNSTYFLGLLSNFWSCNSRVLIESLYRPLTEIIHTYFAILQERCGVLGGCVGEACVLSEFQVFQSHAYSQDDTFSLFCEVYCCRSRANYRRLYEQREHISAGITLQTGCGGGGCGFSLTDLYLQSHLFLDRSYSVTRWDCVSCSNLSLEEE